VLDDEPVVNQGVGAALALATKKGTAFIQSLMEEIQTEMILSDFVNYCSIL